MDDGVTVWADRAQVGDWIHTVFTADLREFLQMVNVYVASDHPVVRLAKLKTAHNAFGTVVSEALPASCLIPFVLIDPHSMQGSFEMRFGLIHFIRVNSAWRKALACLNRGLQPFLIICLSSGTVRDGLIGFVKQSPTDIVVKQLTGNRACCEVGGIPPVTPLGKVPDQFSRSFAGRKEVFE
jgi:hypothetical protein